MSIISEVLQRKGESVLTVGIDATVLDAIGIMSEANIGALVIQENGRPVGIFTERDYMRKIALKGRSSGNTPVRDVMSSPLITVTSDESNDIAMATMTERRCRHLVVVDDQEMTGIVSLGDLVKYLLQEKQVEVDQLSQYIAGSY